MSRQWHVIGYDVCNPKRLHKVARILQGYGHRIQYSIFCVQATTRQIERLRWELSQVLDEEDHLLVISLCSHCAQNVTEQSGTVRWNLEPETFQIIGGNFKNQDASESGKSKN